MARRTEQRIAIFWHFDIHGHRTHSRLDALWPLRELSASSTSIEEPILIRMTVALSSHRLPRRLRSLHDHPSFSGFPHLVP